jgi:hypothetical protein
MLHCPFWVPVVKLSIPILVPILDLRPAGLLVRLSWIPGTFRQSRVGTGGGTYRYRDVVLCSDNNAESMIQHAVDDVSSLIFCTCTRVLIFFSAIKRSVCSARKKKLLPISSFTLLSNEGGGRSTNGDEQGVMMVVISSTAVVYHIFWSSGCRALRQQDKCSSSRTIVDFLLCTL